MTVVHITIEDNMYWSELLLLSTHLKKIDDKFTFEITLKASSVTPKKIIIPLSHRKKPKKR